MSDHVRSCLKMSENVRQCSTMSGNVRWYFRTLECNLRIFEGLCRGNQQLDIDAIAEIDRPIWQVYGSIFGTAIVGLMVVLQWTKLSLISLSFEIRQSLVHCKTTAKATIAVPKTEPCTRHIGLSASAIASISNWWLPLQLSSKFARMSANVRQCPLMFANVRQCPLMFDNVRQCPAMFADIFGHVWTCHTVFLTLPSLVPCFLI